MHHKYALLRKSLWCLTVVKTVKTTFKSLRKLGMIWDQLLNWRDDWRFSENRLLNWRGDWGFSENRLLNWRDDWRFSENRHDTDVTNHNTENVCTQSKWGDNSNRLELGAMYTCQVGWNLTRKMRGQSINRSSNRVTPRPSDTGFGGLWLRIRRQPCDPIPQRRKKQR